MAGQEAFRCTKCRKRNQNWIETDKELVAVSHDDAKEVAVSKAPGERAANWIMNIFGHIYFVYVHVVWFMIWIGYNLFADEPFDPFPFGLLTLVVSLEAIVLAALILIAQNRQSEASEMRAKLDYNADLKAEKNTARIIRLLQKELGQDSGGQNRKR